MFDFFKKKRKHIASDSETTPISLEKKETVETPVANWSTKSADEIWEKVDEARNRGKHNIVFKKATISNSVASELHEAGLRIKIYNSTDAPQFEVFC